MTRNSITLLFVSVLCCVVLVTEGRSTELLQTIGEQDSNESIFIDENEDISDDVEESRFLTGGGTGSATASALNDWITREQQALEKLRPQGGTSSTTGANVIYVNAGATTTGAATTSNNNNGVAGLLIPQVINAALGGRRGAQRRRRRRPTGNRNRRRNRGRAGKPQVFLVRP